LIYPDQVLVASFSCDRRGYERAISISNYLFSLRREKLDSDTESLELNRLAAELRVSQSPALAGRRNVGGNTTRNQEERDLEGPQGMYVEEQEGVNLETVWDMENESLLAGLGS
jgi:hypothetical protein